jgi:hypothetical protein
MPVIATGSTLDPIATLIPDPNVDYAELATAHHALAEAAALDMQRLAAELLALREREAKGTWWLTANVDRAKDESERGIALLRAIGDDIQAVSLEMSQAERTCWNACRNQFVAERMQAKCLPSYGNAPRSATMPRSATKGLEISGDTTPPKSHSAEVQITRRQVDSPLALWQSLVGEWQAPGSWPPDESECFVPERWQVGGWEREALERLVERKRR